MVKTHGRLVARLLIGAFGAYFVAEQLSLTQSFWSVITALVVIQTNVGSTVTASIDRIVGTVAGAVVGAMTGLLHPLGVPGWLPLLLALIPLAFLAAVRPAYRIAPITSVIVILSGADFHPFWLGAFYRVIEISLGAVIGVIVSLLVLPSRARLSIRRDCARALGPLADLAELFLMHPTNPRQDRVNVLNDRVRAAIAGAAKTTQDARREPGARGVLTGMEIRALRRLHSDIIFIGRAMHDWPLRDLGSADADVKTARAWPELDTAMGELEQTLRRGLDALGQALMQGGATDAVHDLPGAIGKVIDVIEHPPADYAAISQRLAVLPFTVQTLHRDMSDFADLLKAEADARSKSPAQVE